MDASDGKSSPQSLDKNAEESQSQAADIVSGAEGLGDAPDGVERRIGAAGSLELPGQAVPTTDPKIISFSFYANKTTVLVRRIWHTYLLLTGAVCVFAVAVSLQVHAFFEFFNGDFTSYAQLALDIFAALAIAAFLALYITCIWDLIISAWSASEFLHVRKLLFTFKWAPRSLAIVWDYLVQFLVISALDVLPIVLGIYFFVVNGFNGFFHGLFGSGTLAALGFAALVFVLEMVNGLVELGDSLLSLCRPRDEKGNRVRRVGIYSLRARAERAGYQIKQTITTFATQPSLEYWFCFSLLVRFAGSQAALTLSAVVSIVCFVICGIASARQEATWYWIAEGTFIIFMVVVWVYGRIWAGAVRILELQMKSEKPRGEPIPSVEPKPDTEVGLEMEEPRSTPAAAVDGYVKLEPNPEFGTLSNPIGHWLARNMQDHMPSAWEDIPVFTPFEGPWNTALVVWLTLSVVTLLIWSSILISRTNVFGIVANVYLAVPFLVLLGAYTGFMRPARLKAMAEESVGPENALTNGSSDPRIPGDFYKLLKGLEFVLYGLVPALALIALLIWFLASNSSQTGATIGFAILYFFIGAVVILAFRLLARGFPTRAFLISFGFLLFLFLLVFAIASTYSESSSTDTAQSANSTGPIASTADPLPFCDVGVYNMTMVDLAFFASIGYSARAVVDDDLETWFGREWTIAFNYTTDPLLWFYEFRQGNLSLVSVRGTQTAVDWMTNLDLWSQVGIFQIADFFIPILRIWPDSWATTMVYLTSATIFTGKTPGHYQPLLQHVQNLKAQGRDIALTGHSLGGGVAGIVGTRTRTRTVTFSPPGIFYSRLKFEIDSALDLDSALISVIVRNDWVSMIDRPAGSVGYLPCDEFPITCHGVARTAVLFQRACGDPRGRRFDPGLGADKYLGPEDTWS